MTELGFAIEKMLANDFYYSHEVHQKIMRRTIVQIKMDAIAIQILKALPKHPKISNLEGIILKMTVLFSNFVLLKTNSLTLEQIWMQITIRTSF